MKIIQYMHSYVLQREKVHQFDKSHGRSKNYQITSIKNINENDLIISYITIDRAFL